MNILHNIGWKAWVVRLLIRKGASKRRSHVKSTLKRDMLSQANRHLLRYVGLSNLAEERSKDGHR
jgi:hypothetical protein